MPMQYVELMIIAWQNEQMSYAFIKSDSWINHIYVYGCDFYFKVSVSITGITIYFFAIIMVHQCITECDLLTFRIYIFRKQCDLQSELWQCLPMPCFETDQIQRVYAIYLCFIAVCYICPRFASYPGIKYVVSLLSHKYSSYRSSKFILAPMRVVYISKASRKMIHGDL